MLSSKEYVAAHGVKCPFCGSYDIQGGSVNIEDGHAFQDVGCDNCDAEWTDRYVLDAYFVIREPEVQP